MGKANVSRRIVIADDFDDYMRRAQITGNGQISNPSYGVMQVYSPSLEDKAYLAVNFFLPRGAFVEVTCEAKQDDANMSGRIGVDQRVDDAAVGGSNVDYVEIDSREWKPYRMVVPGDPKNPYTTVTFGQWKAGAGKSSFRNMVITIYNAEDQNPQFRGGMIRKSGSNWYTDDSVGRFASFGMKTEIVVHSDHVHLNFVETKGWLRPIVFAQWTNYGNGKNYEIRTDGHTKTGVDLYFYWANNGSSNSNPINPAQLADGFIQVLAITV